MNTKNILLVTLALATLMLVGCAPTEAVPDKSTASSAPGKGSTDAATGTPAGASTTAPQTGESTNTGLQELKKGDSGAY